MELNAYAVLGRGPHTLSSQSMNIPGAVLCCAVLCLSCPCSVSWVGHKKENKLHMI
jgi:hypothetical protein